MKDSTMMRAKLIVSGVTQFGENERLNFNAIGKNTGYDNTGLDENNTFAKYTPSANLEMYVNNPALVGKFKVGDKFYVDFTPAE